jgi:hypothetical protein
MGTERSQRTRKKTSKSKRRSRSSSTHLKALQSKILNGHESNGAEGIDRLLLSSLKLWEVERDLIEERKAARGR